MFLSKGIKSLHKVTLAWRCLDPAEAARVDRKASGKEITLTERPKCRTDGWRRARNKVMGPGEIWVF